MFPALVTQTRLSQGAHILSDAKSMLGNVAGVYLRRPSQAERQFMKLQKQLRHFTSQASPEFRLKVISYGEARFWDMPQTVDLEPTLAGVVNMYVAKAKAA